MLGLYFGGVFCVWCHAGLFFKRGEEEFKAVSAVVKLVAALPVGEAEFFLAAEGAEVFTGAVGFLGSAGKIKHGVLDSNVDSQAARRNKRGNLSVGEAVHMVLVSPVAESNVGSVVKEACRVCGFDTGIESGGVKGKVSAVGESHHSDAALVYIVLVCQSVDRAAEAEHLKSRDAHSNLGQGFVELISAIRQVNGNSLFAHVLIEGPEQELGNENGDASFKSALGEMTVNAGAVGIRAYLGQTSAAVLS